MLLLVECTAVASEMWYTKCIATWGVTMIEKKPVRSLYRSIVI